MIITIKHILAIESTRCDQFREIIIQVGPIQMTNRRHPVSNYEVYYIVRPRKSGLPSYHPAAAVSINYSVTDVGVTGSCIPISKNSETNCSNIDPHTWMYVLYYTHMPLFGIISPQIHVTTTTTAAGPLPFKSIPTPKNNTRILSISLITQMTLRLSTEFHYCGYI